MAIVKKGDSPKTARIKIKYPEGKKPIVTFSYPCKKHQFEGSMFTWVLIAWMILLSPFYMSYTTGKNEMEIMYTPTTLETFTKCAAEHPDVLEENWTLIRNEICEEEIETPVESLRKTLQYLGKLLAIFLVPPIIINFIFKKQLANLFPKWQAFLQKKKIKKFTSKDVEYDDKRKCWYCEVPSFANIVLNFNATKDFSKYMDEFEIREHDFKYLKTRRKKKKMKKGKYVPPKTFNEWLWWARFYFSSPPKTGELEVVFK